MRAAELKYRGPAESGMMRAVVVAFLIAVIATGSGNAFAAEQPAEGEVEIPLERRPYQVRLLMAFSPDAFDATAANEIVNEASQSARRCAGEIWSLKVDAISWLGSVSARGLERLDYPTLVNRHPGESADVWFVAVVESLTVGTRVSVRSWQPEIQLQTVQVSEQVMDPREISMTVVRLCRDLMRPMGHLEQVDGQNVRIRLRMGEFSPADPTFTQLAKGDLLVPIVVFRDKNNSIQRLQSIPWTYVSVDAVEGSTVAGIIRSGLRGPLSGKKRPRIDTVLVAIRPQYSSSRLEVMNQAKTPIPLVAHRVEVRTEPIIPKPTKEQPDLNPASTLLNELLTDRRGMTFVDVDPARSLVWLFVFSGDQQLARVPFVPGLTQNARLEVPDDSTRLTAEADLQMLQGEVIDAVALRMTAFSTIRSAAKKDDWKVVNQKLLLLRQIQDAGGLLDRLNAIRVAATSVARARKDRVSEVRINRICDDTETLIKSHLADDKIRLLIEEMSALQGAAVTSESTDKK